MLKKESAKVNLRKLVKIAFFTMTVGLISLLALSPVQASSTIVAKIPQPVGHGKPIISQPSDGVARADLIKVFGQRAAHARIVHNSETWAGTTSETSYISQTSNVWSGYIADVQPTPYYANHVNGGFIVPYVNTNNSPNVSEWVGIGGYNGNNLIQAGAGTTTFQGHNAVATFFQLYGQGNPVNLWVIPQGDSVYVSIDANNTNAGDWTISVYSSEEDEAIDETIQNFFPDRNSAEWIVERSPDSHSGAVPSSIATVDFFDSYWGDNNSIQARSITDSEVGVVRAVTFKDTINGTNECLVPGNLQSPGNSSSFSVSYRSSC